MALLFVSNLVQNKLASGIVAAGCATILSGVNIHMIIVLFGIGITIIHQQFPLQVGGGSACTT